MDPIRIPQKGGDVVLPVTEENYLSLRKAYRIALRDKQGTFQWRKIWLERLYAKYILEYMEMSPTIQAVMNEDDPEKDE